MDRLTEPAGIQQNMSKGSCNIFDTGTVINGKWVVLEFIGKGAISVTARRYGQHPASLSAGFANDGCRMNRAAVKILAPVNDAVGIDQIVDIIVFA